VRVLSPVVEPAGERRLNDPFSGPRYFEVEDGSVSCDGQNLRELGDGALDVLGHLAKGRAR
jgi:hypothetical protein